MPPPENNRPILWIFAGPNGSGKSRFYEEVGVDTIGGSIRIINPDRLAQRISDVEALELAVANLEAVKRIETWLDASIQAHQSVGVETVLSTSKYRRLVETAKATGFKVRLTYVLLDSADRNVARVSLRVDAGGHDVPEEKIRSRRDRSLAQLPWFLNAAEEAWIFDNSGATPRLIGEKQDGEIKLDTAALPEIVRAVQLASEEQP